MAGKRRAIVGAAVAVAAVLLGVAPAGATVVSTTGAAQVTAAPASVAPGAVESDTVVRVITERTLTLSASMTVSITDASSKVTTKTMSAGACLQSHLLHFDAVGSSSAPSVSGTVSFSQPVLAAAPLSPLLDLTDRGTFPFGLPGTTYPAGNITRGIEPLIPVINPNGDLLMLSNPTTVGFTFRTDGFDQARVFTQCDPAPVIPEGPLAVLLPLTAGATLAAAVVVGRGRRGPAAAV